MHDYLLRLLDISQPEVYSRVAAGEIRAVRVAVSEQLPFAGFYRDSGPVSVPVAAMADQPQCQPVSNHWRLVMQQYDLTLAVYYQRIHPPIIVVIANCKSATNNRAVKVRHLNARKSGPPLTLQEYCRPAIRLSLSPSTHFIAPVPVRH